ncbi:MAG: hypothetical protein AMXMBFR64_57000 [Myxococcales bacterium]
MTRRPYEELFEALNRGGVRFAVVGGLAAVLHGVPRMTFDVDLVVDPEPDNMTALVEVLDQAGYRPRISVPLTDLADLASREALRARNMIALSLWHPSRPVEEVDILLAPPLPWSALAQDLQHRNLGSTKVPVVGRATLIALKRYAGRPQDLADIEHLEELDDDA